MIEAIVGACAGDYLLQNDYLSSNKKKSTFVCLIHCLIWSACVMLFAWVWNPYVFAILLTTHFIQDRTHIISLWMELIGQRGFRDGACAPWAAIVVDNVWHIVTIYAVWKAFNL